MLEWAKTIFAYFCQRLDQSGVCVPELTHPLAPSMGQTERAARFDVLLASLRYPLSQPDGCQLSQRESQGCYRARIYFTAC